MVAATSNDNGSITQGQDPDFGQDAAIGLKTIPFVKWRKNSTWELSITYTRFLLLSRGHKLFLQDTNSYTPDWIWNIGNPLLSNGFEANFQKIWWNCNHGGCWPPKMANGCR